MYILFEILPSLTYLDKSILKYRFEISFFTIQKNLVSIPEIKIIINILKIRILHYFINPTEPKDAALLIFSSRKQNLIIKYRFQNFFLTISFNKTLPPTSPPDNVRLNHLQGTEGQDRASHRGCKNGCWCIPFASRIRNFVKSARFFWSYLSSQNSLGRPWKGAKGEHTRVNYKFPKAVAGWNHKFQMRGRLHSTGDSSNRGALMNANWRFSRSASRLLVFVDDPYQKYHHGYKFLWKCNRTKSFHWPGIGGIYLSVVSVAFY